VDELQAKVDSGATVPDADQLQKLGRRAALAAELAEVEAQMV
jgi:hypothetical protein